MFKCYVHDWSSHYLMCPSCIHYNTSSSGTDISITKTGCENCDQLQAERDIYLEALERVVSETDHPYLEQALEVGKKIREGE